MFNIGFSELLILVVIGLLVLGPEQLPVLARKIARILNDLKRVKEEIMSPVDQFKTEAQRLLEEARRQASQMEADALINRKLEEHAGDPPETSDSDSESKPLTGATPTKPGKQDG